MSNIELKALKFGYKSPLLTEPINIILKPVLYWIRGANGSGKSTLLKTIANLVSPLEGEVVLDNGAELEHEILYIPEKDGHFEGLSIDENLVLAGLAYGLNEPEAKTRAHTLMDLFQLQGLDQNSGFLSSGQKKRLSLALALSSRKEFILLDEPFNALDEASISVFCALVDFCLERKLGIIIASHQWPQVLRRPDEVYHLTKEGISSKGTDEFTNDNISLGKLTWI